MTLTTVGYGDITPESPFGRLVAGFIMILGYGIIAVPTGIVTAELTRGDANQVQSRGCNSCHGTTSQPGSKFCVYCGEKFEAV